MIVASSNIRIDLTRLCSYIYETTHYHGRIQHASRRFWGLILVIVALCPSQHLFAQEADLDTLQSLTASVDNLATKFEAVASVVNEVEAKGWWQKNAFWLSPAAILLSAVGSWLLARNAISENRRTAQRQATFEHLSKIRWHDEYIQNYAFFQQIKGEQVGEGESERSRIADVAMRYRALHESGGLKNDDSRTLKILEEFNKLKRVLNEYEAIAAGVKNHSLSKDVVKSEIDQLFCELVNDCSEFISISRDIAGRLMDYPDPDSLYCELIWLADKLETERASNSCKTPTQRA